MTTMKGVEAGRPRTCYGRVGTEVRLIVADSQDVRRRNVGPNERGRRGECLGRDQRTVEGKFALSWTWESKRKLKT